MEHAAAVPCMDAEERGGFIQRLGVEIRKKATWGLGFEE